MITLMKVDNLDLPREIRHDLLVFNRRAGLHTRKAYVVVHKFGLIDNYFGKVQIAYVVNDFKWSFSPDFPLDQNHRGLCYLKIIEGNTPMYVPYL